MDQNILTLFFDLIRFSLTKSEISSKIHLSEEDANQIFALAQRHDISHLIAYALNQNSVVNSINISKEQLFKYQLNAVYRSEVINHTYDFLCKLLEDSGIDFIPLKGSVVSEFYPEAWMRTRGDIDILVREKDIKKTIELLRSAGWELRNKPIYKDYSLYFKNGIHLELHFSIKENIYSLDGVLERVWDHTILCEGFKCKRNQTNEFLLFHLLSHMAYHFLNGGCGIRSFIDIWLLRDKLQFDEKVLRELCREANIEEFYNNILLLIGVWFKQQKHTQVTKNMESYILQGGVYGELLNRVAVQQVENGNRFKNILNRIFMPYESLIIKYPQLKEKKFLTPFFQVYRWIDVIKKGRIVRTFDELKINTDLSQEKINKISGVLRDIGLFNIIDS